MLNRLFAGILAQYGMSEGQVENAEVENAEVNDMLLELVFLASHTIVPVEIASKLPYAWCRWCVGDVRKLYFDRDKYKLKLLYNF